MSFKDIFKKSFLEGFASTEITTLTVVTALGVACLLALYIFFVYRVVTRKTFYSKNFNITLAGVTVRRGTCSGGGHSVRGDDPWYPDSGQAACCPCAHDLCGQRR